MNNYTNAPRRKFGQCLSCYHFWNGLNGQGCFHDNEHDIESTKFCYDWRDIEEGLNEKRIPE